jgi:hypothetical protein
MLKHPAKQPWGGRPNKAAVLRIKLATMVVSIATFVSSLGVIAFLNPGIAKTAGLANQAQTGSTVALANSSLSQISSAALQLPSRSQLASLQPRTRTRGS